MAAGIRQNFHSECEAGINKQINMELYASYVYQSMAFNFSRDDIALPGCHVYFKNRSNEEREHAEKLMEYQNKRGGRIVLQMISKPEIDEWKSAIVAMESAMNLEKTVNQSLIDLHKIAESHDDAQFTDFLEHHYLEEQVTDIKELGDNITMLKRCGSGLGEFQFDRTLSS